MPKSSYREICIILGRVFGLPYCTLTLVQCSGLRAYHVYVNHDYELKCQIHILLDVQQYISYNHEAHYICAVTMFTSNGDVNIGPHPLHLVPSGGELSPFVNVLCDAVKCLWSYVCRVFVSK